MSSKQQKAAADAEAKAKAEEEAKAKNGAEASPAVEAEAKAGTQAEAFQEIKDELREEILGSLLEAFKELSEDLKAAAGTQTPAPVAKEPEPYVDVIDPRWLPSFLAAGAEPFSFIVSGSQGPVVALVGVGRFKPGDIVLWPNTSVKPGQRPSHRYIPLDERAHEFLKHCWPREAAAGRIQSPAARPKPKNVEEMQTIAELGQQFAGQAPVVGTPRASDSK